MEEYSFNQPQQYETPFYKKRRFIVICIVVLLGITAYAIWNKVSTDEYREGKVAVSISTVPKNATIEIDSIGKVSSESTVYLDQGKYKAVVSKEGYESRTETIDVRQDLYPAVYVQLNPESSAAKNEREKDKELMLELQKKQGLKSAQFTETFEKKYPIVKSLPIKDPYYRIGYLSDDGTNMYITVYTESPRYRYNAVKRIESLGYRVSDYKIKFIDYESPLKEAQ